MPMRSFLVRPRHLRAILVDEEGWRPLVGWRIAIALGTYLRQHALQAMDLLLLLPHLIFGDAELLLGLDASLVANLRALSLLLLGLPCSCLGSLSLGTLPLGQLP